VCFSEFVLSWGAADTAGAAGTAQGSCVRQQTRLPLLRPRPTSPAPRPLLQGFINNSFANIGSTEHALSLLLQFRAIMQRPSLQRELATKWLVIFQHYARDLELVRRAEGRGQGAGAGRRRGPPGPAPLPDAGPSAPLIGGPCWRPGRQLGQAVLEGWRGRGCIPGGKRRGGRGLQLESVRPAEHGGLPLPAQVQALYEKHKAAPPVPRNAPPVAGACAPQLAAC
jgi:hypothetical protein